MLKKNNLKQGLRSQLLAGFGVLLIASSYPGSSYGQRIQALQSRTTTATETISLPAEIKAYRSAVLTAKVAGYLKSLRVDKGDRVQEGDLIAEIEVPELIADQAQFKAQVAVARSEFDRVQSAIKTAPDLVTPTNVDQTRAKLQVAQAQLDRVDTLLRYARITAPFSGTITARFVDPGAFIPVPTNSDQQSAAVVALMDFSRVRVQIPVPEENALKVTKGSAVTFTVQGLPLRVFRDTITRISYAVDQSSQTMLAEIDMQNPGEILRPGMYATAHISLLASPEITKGGGTK
jgi:membrane fusion protein, multidrug efflux system